MNALEVVGIVLAGNLGIGIVLATISAVIDYGVPLSREEARKVLLQASLGPIGGVGWIFWHAFKAAELRKPKLPKAKVLP